MNLSYSTASDAQTLEKAKKNPRWKGESALYATKHQFLARNFGRITNCEHCEVEGKYEKGGKWSIQWAKKQGVEYSHNRTDYIGLCRSCHRKYDMTDKERARLQAMAKNQSPEQLAKLSIVRSKIAKTRPRNEKGHYIALNPKEA
jgi:hypothetical protein